MTRRLLLIAGVPSHKAGAHEHRAGMLLLQHCLSRVDGLDVEVHDGGWVTDDAAFDRADAVAIYADGGPRHPLLQDDHLERITSLVGERAIGLGLLHYGVELPEGEGADLVDRWVGGHYASGISCNPIWEAEIASFPDHPVANGLQPFTTTDEWYFDIQFASAGVVTPILAATMCGYGPWGCT